MVTRIVPIGAEDAAAGSAAIREGAELIRAGELVAFPTETVYGLGADAKNPDASRRIYAAKGRPSDNPLIVHIADIDGLYDAAALVNDAAARLAEAFWPGPLTIILPRAEDIPTETTGGLNTVALRLPSHPVARELIRASGCMIAAPSANASGRPSPTTAQHVFSDLSGRIPLILDGGPVDIGIESTIVDCTLEVPVILRPGYVTRAMVEKVCGQCDMDPATAAPDAPPKAPGMKYRHYAPRAPLTIVEGSREKVIDYINSQIRLAGDGAGDIGIIASSEVARCCIGGRVISLGSRRAPGEIAAGLYGALRRMDDYGVAMIFAESLYFGPAEGLAGSDGSKASDSPKGGDSLEDAIMNRLSKAAGHRTVRV